MRCISPQPSPSPLRSDRTRTAYSAHSRSGSAAIRTTPRISWLSGSSAASAISRVVDLGKPRDEGMRGLFDRREEPQPQVLRVHPRAESRIARLVLRPHRPHADAPPGFQGEPAFELARVGADDETRIRSAPHAAWVIGLSVEGRTAFEKR